MKEKLNFKEIAEVVYNFFPEAIVSLKGADKQLMILVDESEDYNSIAEWLHFSGIEYRSEKDTEFNQVVFFVDEY